LAEVVEQKEGANILGKTAAALKKTLKKSRCLNEWSHLQVETTFLK